MRSRLHPPGGADAPDEGAAGEEPRRGVPQEPGDRLSEEGPAQIRGQRSQSDTYTPPGWSNPRCVMVPRRRNVRGFTGPLRPRGHS